MESRGTILRSAGNLDSLREQLGVIGRLTQQDEEIIAEARDELERYELLQSHDQKVEALALLEKLAMHVGYDQGVSGSKFTDSPYGNVPLGPDSFWTIGAEPFLEGGGGELGQLIRDINFYLRENENADAPYASLPIDETQGSLWQRLQANFPRPPDVLTDVVAPLIREEVAEVQESVELSEEEQAVLEYLGQGGSLRYFYLHGGVAVHGEDGAPDRDQSCGIQAFLDLREKGLIDQTRRDVIGYPHYADSHKSSEYKITGAGHACLARVAAVHGEKIGIEAPNPEVPQGQVEYQVGPSSLSEIFNEAASQGYPPEVPAAQAEERSVFKPWQRVAAAGGALLALGMAFWATRDKQPVNQEEILEQLRPKVTNVEPGAGGFPDLEPDVSGPDPLTEFLNSIVDELPSSASGVLADVLDRLDSDSDQARAQAAKDLGFLFANGLGVGEDDSVANELFRLALELDPSNAQANYDLGYHTAFGKGGLEADADSAMSYFAKAAQAQNPLVPQQVVYLHSIGAIGDAEANSVLGEYGLEV